MSHCPDFNNLVGQLAAYIEKHGASNAAAAMSQVFEDQLETDEEDRPDDWCEQSLVYRKKVAEYCSDALDVRTDRFDREEVAQKLDVLIYDLQKIHKYLTTTKGLLL